MRIRRLIPDGRETDLLCVGSLVFEQIHKVAGLHAGSNQNSSEILNSAAGIGGSASNVACRAAEIGARASLLAGLGDGAFSEELMAGLSGYGVDPRFLRVRRGVDSALVVLLTDSDGGWAAYHRIAPELALLAEDCPTTDELGDVRIVHVDGYSFFSAGTRAFVECVLERSRAAGCLVSVDAATPSLLTQPDFACWVMKQADIVFLNEHEEELAFGAGAAVDVLLASAPEAVIVKRGAEGAVVSTPEAQVEIPAEPVIVADTLGAGDTFVAATLCGLASDLPLETAVQRGIAAGGRACTGYGSMGAALRA